MGDRHSPSGRHLRAIRPRSRGDREARGGAKRTRPDPAVRHAGRELFLAGRVDEARELAPQELEFARAQKARGREAWVYHLFAELATRRDLPDAEAAETHYRQALTLAEELGMRPLVAHCHLGLAKLSRRTGKREQAHEHLTAATTMYREMDMRFYLEQAEAAQRQLETDSP